MIDQNTKFPLDKDMLEDYTYDQMLSTKTISDNIIELYIWNGQDIKIATITMNYIKKIEDVIYEIDFANGGNCYLEEMGVYRSACDRTLQDDLYVILNTILHWKKEEKEYLEYIVDSFEECLKLLKK